MYREEEEKEDYIYQLLLSKYTIKKKKNYFKNVSRSYRNSLCNIKNK